MGNACSANCDKKEEAPARAADAAVVGAVNRTGIEVLQALAAADKTGGVVLNAPISLTSPLTVAALGGKGETQAGILKALAADSYSANPSEWLAKVKDVTSGLVSNDKSVTVLSKNAIFSKILQPAFVKSNAAADIELQKSPPTVAAVNGWVNKATKQKIPTILDPSAPLEEDSTVILNAMYFKGEWKDKFDPAMTEDSEFKGALAKSPCKMMRATGSSGKHFYCETDAYQAAMLPYGKTGQFSAVLVLPRDSDSPTVSVFGGGKGGQTLPGAAAAPRASSLEEVLTLLPQDWESLADPASGNSKLTEMKGLLRLPRFKVDYTAKLNDALKARGMTVAFTPAADFSVMCQGATQVTDVVQRITLEVDEVGSVAAAATAVVMSKGIDMSPSFSMTCDRPFFFAIRANASNAILFAAAVRAV